MCKFCRRVHQDAAKAKECEARHPAATHAVVRYTPHDTDHPSIVMVRIDDTWWEFNLAAGWNRGNPFPGHRNDPRREGDALCADPAPGLSLDVAIEKPV